MKNCTLQFHKSRLLISMLLAVCFLLVTAGTAYAAEATVNLPVRQEFTVSNAGSDTISRVGTYQLTEISGSATVLPSGAKNGVYTFDITGNDSTLKIPFTYTQAGIYKYELQQTSTASGDNAKSYTYDSSVYYITVQVKSAADGTLTAKFVVSDKETDGTKYDEICYRNSYTGAAVGPDSEPITDKIAKVIKTGDTAQIALVAAVALAALGALIIILFLRKRHKDEEDPAPQAGQL